MRGDDGWSIEPYTALEKMRIAAASLNAQATVLEDAQWRCFAALVKKYAELAQLKQAQLDIDQSDLDTEACDYRAHEIRARPQDAAYIMEKVVRLFGAEAVLLGLEKTSGCVSIAEWQRRPRGGSTP